MLTLYCGGESSINSGCMELVQRFPEGPVKCSVLALAKGFRKREAWQSSYAVHRIINKIKDSWLKKHFARASRKR